MIRFLAWCRAVLLSVVTGLAKFVVLIAILVLVLAGISLARGDGLASNMVLSLDLRDSISDSAAGPASFLTSRKLTVMDLVLALDAAGRDGRIKGLVMRLGDGAVSTAQAQEIAAALKRFRARGKFVIAQADAFNGAGLGDYVAASAADQVWMQPKSNFAPAGTGGGEIFLRGLLDKVGAQPQIAKRAEFKSAADMFMEKDITAPDRQQLQALMQSVYDSAVADIAAARHLPRAAVVAALEASPQFSEDARKAKLIDRIGYDDQIEAEAARRAGTGVKTVKMADYIRSREGEGGFGAANIAIVEASGEIHDGTARNSPFTASGGIFGDDMAAAVRAAARNASVKAIVLRVDSPGGSVTASDKILHAVKAAQARGKPVVVSMGSVAASGGYYISASADRIVAEPATITGSIGVLTGKVSLAGTAKLVGVGTAEVAVGANTLMDSPFSAYTPQQWAALNREADVIYDDFTAKVAKGRKLPLEQVRAVAKGRVWSGADAKAHRLVDEMGGFWTAAGLAASLGKIAPADMSFRVYPQRRGILGGLSLMLERLDARLALWGRVESLLASPAADALLGEISALPAGTPGSAVQLRAAHLPRGL
jgi:protease-4